MTSNKFVECCSRYYEQVVRSTRYCITLLKFSAHLNRAFKQVDASIALIVKCDLNEHRLSHETLSATLRASKMVSNGYHISRFQCGTWYCCAALQRIARSMRRIDLPGMVRLTAATIKSASIPIGRQQLEMTPLQGDRDADDLALQGDGVDDGLRMGCDLWPCGVVRRTVQPLHRR
jgi:hypothetical protein